MKKLSTLFVALLFGLVMSGIAFADNGPATIDFPGGKKGVVHFDHHKHQASMKCGECHHGADHSEYAEGMAIKKCADCHNAEMANKKLNKPMKAFHTNCKGCHKAEKKGPTKCGACHKK